MRSDLYSLTCTLLPPPDGASFRSPVQICRRSCTTIATRHSPTRGRWSVTFPTACLAFLPKGRRSSRRIASHPPRKCAPTSMPSSPRPKSRLTFDSGSDVPRCGARNGGDVEPPPPCSWFASRCWHLVIHRAYFPRRMALLSRPLARLAEFKLRRQTGPARFSNGRPIRLSR